MKLRQLILLLALLLLCQTRLTLAGSSIEGRVVDLTTHKPISGATVEVRDGVFHVATDDNGSFRFNDLDGGKYTISVTHVGYDSVVQVLSVGDDSEVEITLYAEPRVISVEGITVTATPYSADKFIVPSGVSVTPGEKFSERAPTTTAEVLREEPGVLVQKTTAGHGAPIIRGLIGKHVLLLYDGIRLNKPTFRFGGNQYLNTIDLGSLEKIEVVRGPSSVMYGSEAMGGTVNLVPSRQLPTSDRMVLIPSLSSRYSSADDGRCATLKIAGGGGRFSGVVAGTYRKVGDLHAGGDIGDQVPTGWEETDFSSNVMYQLSGKTYLKLDYLAVRQNNVPRYDNYVTGDYQKYIYEPQNRDLVALSLDSRLPTSLIHSLRMNVSYQNETEGRIQQKTESPDITTDTDKIATWGTSLQMSSMVHRSHWISLGWDYYHDFVNSERYTMSDGMKTYERGAFPDKSRYRSAGLFVQDEFTVARRLRLTLGVRYSYVEMESPLEEPFGLFSESYQDVTGATSLSYELHPTLNLMASWSRGFRAPSLNDAVVLKKSSSGVDAPSFGLNSETSNNFEVGVKLQRSSMNGSLFLFYNRLGGLIDRKPGVYDGKTFFDEDGDGIQNPTEYDIYQRKNIGDSRIYGFEFDYAVIFNRWIESRANCFWTYGENRTDHEPLSRIPPLMGMLSMRFNATSNAWIEIYVRAARSQRRLSQRDIDDTRIAENGTPSWGTLNLRAGIRFGDFRIDAGVQNITDSEYKEHGSGVFSAGRSFNVAVRVQPDIL